VTMRAGVKATAGTRRHGRANIAPKNIDNVS
jgi:hypothetical protein